MERKKIIFLKRKQKKKVPGFNCAILPHPEKHTLWELLRAAGAYSLWIHGSPQEMNKSSRLKNE